ncbi:hypothetical protein [Capnocytophaga genosp. AHN8471]|nr:hypothetical protein [Capnocytophaga genosp. AHN8471]
MKSLFLILFFSLYNLCFSQLSTAMQWEKLYRGSIDSVIVVSSSGYTKETSPNIEGFPEEQIVETIKKIHYNKGVKLLNALQQKKSFNEAYPLVNDVCDTFYFYRNGQQKMTLIFIFSTRAVTIYRGDDLIFAGSATPFLQKKIGKTLGYNFRKIEGLNR